MSGRTIQPQKQVANYIVGRFKLCPTVPVLLVGVILGVSTVTRHKYYLRLAGVLGHSVLNL